MSTTAQLGLMMLIVGTLLGAGGTFAVQTTDVGCRIAAALPRFDRDDCHQSGIIAGVRTPDDGLKPSAVPEEGLSFRIRPTDVVGRLTDEGNEVIGVRIFDPLNGEIADAPHVDVIWRRQAAFQDLPTATGLDEYRSQSSDTFKIEQTRELTIGGKAAIKQLYTLQVEVPGPFGSKQQRPMPGLRWVVDRGEGELLVLRSPVASQKYLDLVALSLSFTEKRAAGAVTKDAGLTELQGSIEVGGPDANPKQGTGELDVLESSDGLTEVKLE